MKQILSRIVLVVMIVVAISACDSSSEQVLYDGPEYVLFSDTLSYFPVTNSDDYFNITIGSTVACDYDRTFAVEVDDQNSNAIEGFHYVIESNSVTIKAGERAADLKIRGLYENIDDLDSLSLTLNLLTDEDLVWEEYGSKTRVQILKSCPFDINVFTGYCKVTSSFYDDYMSSTDFRLLKAEQILDEENSIVIHDFFYQNYDIRFSFETGNPLEPFVDFDAQVLGSTAEAFGTTYGNGKLMVSPLSGYSSYYNVCQNFVLLYMNTYVENVGTVGGYMTVIEWISDDEAEYLKKLGY